MKYRSPLTVAKLKRQIKKIEELEGEDPEAALNETLDTAEVVFRAIAGGDTGKVKDTREIADTMADHLTPPDED